MAHFGFCFGNFNFLAEYPAKNSQQWRHRQQKLYLHDNNALTLPNYEKCQPFYLITRFQHRSYENTGWAPVYQPTQFSRSQHRPRPVHNDFIDIFIPPCANVSHASSFSCHLRVRERLQKWNFFHPPARLCTASQFSLTPHHTLAEGNEKRTHTISRVIQQYWMKYSAVWTAITRSRKCVVSSARLCIAHTHNRSSIARVALPTAMHTIKNCKPGWLSQNGHSSYLITTTSDPLVLNPFSASHKCTTS